MRKTEFFPWQIICQNKSKADVDLTYCFVDELYDNVVALQSERVIAQKDVELCKIQFEELCSFQMPNQHYDRLIIKIKKILLELEHRCLSQS